MKPKLHLWPQQSTLTETHLTFSARLELVGYTLQDLWYRVPIRYQSWISPNSDPFLVATLLFAMRRASAIIVHGSVSPTLLQNLEYLQEIWTTWSPQRYHKISIQADIEKELPISGSERFAISSFSGGVDSSYTVAHHKLENAGRSQENLTAGLMVHGLDIPLKEAEMFDIAATRSQRILQSVEMELIPLATNWRDVIDVPWEDGFGTAVMAALMVFQGHFQVGLIASGRSYERPKFPWGSTPLSDRYCSSGRFEIIHDGAHKDRLGKIEALSQWPEALDNLRVCWQGAQKDQNCCRCEKCIRTILAFRVLGCEQPACFPKTVSDAQIRQLRLRGTALDEMALVHSRAQQVNPKGTWVKTLSADLQRNRAINHLQKLMPLFWKQKLQKLAQSFS